MQIEAALVHPASLGSRQHASADPAKAHPAASGAITTAEEYMGTTSPPDQLPAVREAMRAFVAANAGRRVACVTAGGTIVPLEKNMVRFLDSVSTGARSSGAAEQFLARGYAVVYLHRRGCMVPFAREFQAQSGSQFFDGSFLDLVTPSGGGVTVADPSGQGRLAAAAAAYQAARQEGRLLLVPFLSNVEYLWLQKEIAFALEPMQKRTLFFFASTLSPFYLPETAEHKIQRTKQGVTLQLKFVPNLLTMFKSWLKDTYCVGFKLETDPALLLENGRKMVRQNHHHVCVCNMLQTRHRELQLVTADSHQTITKRDEADDIEAQLADALIELHSGYVGEPLPASAAVAPPPAAAAAAAPAAPAEDRGSGRMVLAAVAAGVAVGAMAMARWSR